MQAYSENFARVYNTEWIGFVRQVAPFVLDYYKDTPAGKDRRPVLDLCCGTGQLARHFLEREYRVVGIDLSDPMLRYARENNIDYIVSEQAEFIQADAADFSLDETFGLVVSTYDALNHLPDVDALSGCFRSVYQALEEGGYFIFDLNTESGLRRWGGVQITDREGVYLIIRGFIEMESQKAWTQITGFARIEGDTYTRFDETVYNTLFDIQHVIDLLYEAGFQDVHPARVQSLAEPLESPESEGRVFFVASK